MGNYLKFALPLRNERQKFREIPPPHRYSSKLLSITPALVENRHVGNIFLI